MDSGKLYTNLIYTFKPVIHTNLNINRKVIVKYVILSRIMLVDNIIRTDKIRYRQWVTDAFAHRKNIWSILITIMINSRNLL